ncbi:hypothetical protein Ahy_A05g021872 isoform D [Arachis hypogaea]|uniref:Uncharacterized protein n=1 Tax=Arachis hypogaea TaxID=3818 RepID=A0A445CYP7_ARAHY|nr:hypothetical protein Ahy_A05g021872 isoform D [Arachis hypogaea]
MSLGFEMQAKEPPEERVMVSASVPAPEHQKPRLNLFAGSFDNYYTILSKLPGEGMNFEPDNSSEFLPNATIEYCEPLLAKIQQTMIRLKIQPIMIASAPLASKVFSAFKQKFHGGFHQDPLFWKSVVAEWCATLEEEKIRRSRCRQWWNDATNEGSTQTSFCGLKSLPESIIRMSFRQFLL